MGEAVAPQGLSERTREALRRHLMRVTPVVPTAESAALAERADREETEALARMKAELEEHLRRSSSRAALGLPPPSPAPPWWPGEGERVEVRIKGEWVPALVLRQPTYFRIPDGKLRVRRVGRTAGGGAYGPRNVLLAGVRPARDYDPVRANVYADWLEEHGEAEAAGKLREAFPLG